jgi:hypothetical protein
VSSTVEEYDDGVRGVSGDRRMAAVATELGGRVVKGR